MYSNKEICDPDKKIDGKWTEWNGNHVLKNGPEKQTGTRKCVGQKGGKDCSELDGGNPTKLKIVVINLVQLMQDGVATTIGVNGLNVVQHVVLVRKQEKKDVFLEMRKDKHVHN